MVLSRRRNRLKSADGNAGRARCKLCRSISFCVGLFVPETKAIGTLAEREWEEAGNEDMSLNGVCVRACVRACVRVCVCVVDVCDI